MSYGGHALDMVLRMKQNAALLKKHRSRFKRKIKYKSKKTEYNFPKLSDFELQRYKLKIQEEAKKENKKKLLYYIIIICVIFIALLIFNFV